MKRHLTTALAALVLAAAGTTASAANVSFTGTLPGDNAVQLFSFTLDAISDVTLRSWSYAGGVNAAGQAIAAGGFDPLVTLFDGLGAGALLIDANDDGLGVAIDPVTGNAYDSLLELLALPVGSYTVALSQFANFAGGPTLGDGFIGGGNAGFDGRSAAWALDILSVARASVIAEPSALAMALLALVGAGLASGSRGAARGRWRPAA